MLVKDFDYELPEELIAQDPLEKRSNSRLMVLDKNTGETIHKHFYDICAMLVLPVWAKAAAVNALVRS